MSSSGRADGGRNPPLLRQSLLQGDFLVAAKVTEREVRRDKEGCFRERKVEKGLGAHPRFSPFASL